MTMATQTRAAALVLEHAQKIGLPEPWVVEVTPWAVEVCLRFKSIGDLAEWARYTETQIVENELPSGSLHFSIGETEGPHPTVIEQPIRALYVLTAEERAA